jgi:hypothetical protein
MFSGTEERSTPASDRQAMERNLQDLHRILDQYEGELAAQYAALEKEVQTRPHAPGGLY